MVFTRKNLTKILLCGGVFWSVFMVPNIDAQVVVLPCSDKVDCENLANATNTTSFGLMSFDTKEKYELLANYYEISVQLDPLLAYFAVKNLSFRSADQENLDAINFIKSEINGQTIESINKGYLLTLKANYEILVVDLTSIKKAFEVYSTAFLNNDTEDIMKGLELLIEYYEQFGEAENLGFIYATGDGAVGNLKSLVAQFEELKMYVDRAGTSFDKLQRTKRKNMRQYRIVMEYVRTKLLTAESFQQQENESLGIPAVELKRNHESILFSEIEAGIASKRVKADWSIQKEKDLYKELITYFEKPLDNPVAELRKHTSNGDILPGTRNAEGTDFVMQNVLPGVINTILVVILSVSVLMLMAGGGLYVMSAGNAESTKKALDMIIWTVVGTVAAVLVFSAVKFIIGIDYTNNEDKMPSVTEVRTDKKGALIERGFDNAGNLDGGAALSVGVLSVREGLEALNLINGDDENVDPDDGTTDPLDEDIAITGLMLTLPQGQQVNDGDEIPMMGAGNQREIPDLIASVQTNLGDSETEVLEWRLQQQSNSVVLNPSTKTGLQAVYSALADVTGGDYRLSVKVQKKDDPSDFVWSDPIDFVVTEGALLKAAEYSTNGQEWRELRSTGEMNVIPFNYEGIYFRFGVQTRWGEMIFDQTPTLTGYAGLSPVRSSYDDYLGYAEVYTIDNPQSGSYNFVADVVNGTQTETRSTAVFNFDTQIDRTLNIESINWGIFENQYLPQSNDPNTVCIKTNLGPFITVDWRIVSNGNPVINPINTPIFDPATGLCADYPTLVPGVYTMSPEIIDSIDQNNLILGQNKTFEVRQDVAASSFRGFKDVMATPADLSPSEIISLDYQLSPIKTPLLDFYVQTNLGTEVDIQWDAYTIDDDVGTFINDLSYDQTTGKGARFEFDTVGTYTIEATITDQYLPSNTITVPVWNLSVTTSEIFIDSIAVQIEDLVTGDPADMSISDTVQLIDSLRDKRISDIKIEAFTNFGNNAEIGLVEMTEAATGNIVATSTDGNLIEIYGVSPGIYFLNILVRDRANPSNEVWDNNFWFSVEDMAVVTAGEYSINNGQTWEVLTTTTNELPYYFTGAQFRMSVNSSWADDAFMVTELDGDLPTEVGTDYTVEFGYADTFAVLPLEVRDYEFTGEVQNNQTGITMDFPETIFPITSIDRSIVILEEDLGLFTMNLIPESLNIGNTVCVQSNLGDEVTVLWEMQDSLGAVIVPPVSHPFAPATGHCASFDPLPADDYTVYFTLTDTVDVNNVYVSATYAFTTEIAFVIEEALIQYNGSTPTDLLNNTVRARPYINQGYTVDDGLRVTGTTNYTTAVTVINAEIQDLQGNIIYSATTLGTSAGSAVAEFAPFLFLPLGDYQMVLDMALVDDLATVETIIEPFRVSGFRVINTSFLEGSYQASQNTLVPITNGAFVPNFDSEGWMEGRISLELTTDLPNNVELVNWTFVEAETGVAVPVLSAATEDAAKAKVVLDFGYDQLNTPSWFSYGDYILTMNLRDQQNPVDEQAVPLLVTIEAPATMALLQLEYPYADGASSVPFGQPVEMRFRSNYFTQSLVSTSIEWGHTGNSFFSFDETPVWNNDLYESTFSELPPKTYHIKILVEDSLDTNNKHPFVNEAAVDGQTYQFPLVVDKPPLLARNNTTGPWINAADGSAGIFDKTQPLQIKSAFWTPGVIITPSWAIYDSAGGLPVLDKGMQTLITTEIFPGQYTHEIDISSLESGSDYYLVFEEKTPSFVNSADIKHEGFLFFDITDIQVQSYDLGIWSSSVVFDDLPNTVCLETDLQANASVVWELFEVSTGIFTNPTALPYDGASGGWCALFQPLSAGDYEVKARVIDLNDSTNVLTTNSTSFTVLKDFVIDDSTVALATTSTIDLPNNNLQVSWVSGDYIASDDLLVTINTNQAMPTEVLSAEIQYADGTTFVLADGLDFSVTGGVLTAQFSNLVFLGLGDYQVVLAVASVADNTNMETFQQDFTVSTFAITQSDILFADYTGANEQSLTEPFEITPDTQTYPDHLTGRIKQQLTTDLTGTADVSFSALESLDGNTIIDSLLLNSTGNPAGTQLSFWDDLPYGDYTWTVELAKTIHLTDTQSIQQNIRVLPPQQYLTIQYVSTGGLPQLAVAGDAGSFYSANDLRVSSAFSGQDPVPISIWSIKDNTDTVVLSQADQTILPTLESAVYGYDLDISTLAPGNGYTLEFAETSAGYEAGFIFGHTGNPTFSVTTVEVLSYDLGGIDTGMLLDTDLETVCIDTNFGANATVNFMLKDSAQNLVSPSIIPTYDVSVGGWCTAYGLMSVGTHTLNINAYETVNPLNSIEPMVANFSVVKPIEVTDTLFALSSSPGVSVLNSSIKVTSSTSPYVVSDNIMVTFTTNQTTGVLVESAEIQKLDGTVIATATTLGSTAIGSGTTVMATFTGPLSFVDLGAYQIVAVVEDINISDNSESVMVPFTLSSFELIMEDWTHLEDSAATTSVYLPVASDNIVRPHAAFQQDFLVVMGNFSTNLPSVDIASSQLMNLLGNSHPTALSDQSGASATSDWWNANFQGPYGTYLWSVQLENPSDSSDIINVEKKLHVLPKAQDLTVQSGINGSPIIATAGHAGPINRTKILRVYSAIPATDPVPAAIWTIKDDGGSLWIDNDDQTIIPTVSGAGYVYDIDITNLPLKADYALDFAETSSLYASGIEIDHNGTLIFDSVEMTQISYNAGLFATDSMTETDTTTVCVDTNLGSATTATWNLTLNNTTIAPTSAASHHVTNGWCADYSGLVAGNYDFDVTVADNNIAANAITSAPVNFTVKQNFAVTNINKIFSDFQGNSLGSITSNNEVTPFILGKFAKFNGRITLQFSTNLSSADDAKIYQAEFKPVNGGNAIPGMHTTNGTTAKAQFTFNNTVMYGDYEFSVVIGDTNDSQNTVTVTEIFHIVPPSTISLLYVRHDQASSANTFSVTNGVRFTVKSSNYSQETLTASLVPTNPTKLTLTQDITGVNNLHLNSVIFSPALPGIYDLHITSTDSLDPTKTQTFINPTPTDGLAYAFPIVINRPDLIVYKANGTSYVGNDNNFSPTNNLMVKSLFHSGDNFTHTPKFEIKDSAGNVIASDSTLTTISAYLGSMFHFIPLSTIPIGTGYELHFNEEIAEIANGAPIHYDGPFIFNVQ